MVYHRIYKRNDSPEYIGRIYTKLVFRKHKNVPITRDVLFNFHITLVFPTRPIIIEHQSGTSQVPLYFFFSSISNIINFGPYFDPNFHCKPLQKLLQTTLQKNIIRNIAKNPQEESAHYHNKLSGQNFGLT